MSTQRIWAVIGKETREIIRDPITVWICALFPLVMLFLFGYAISLDVEDVALGVLDEDKSPASRALTDRFVHSGYFSVARSFAAAGEVGTALQRGEVKLAVVVPPGFQTALVRGDMPPVQLVVDGTYSATALIVANYARTIVATYRRPEQRAVRVETRIWYNPSLRSVNYVVPGLYGVILMAFPPLLTTLALVREKETGSIQQIFVSPLTSAEFLIGKLLPYGLIAFVQMVMVMTTGYFWFAVPFQGNLGFLVVTALIYVFCTVEIGLLISALTRSQTVAMLAALLVTLMPSFLFSGFLFPIFTMPYVLQLYTRIFPARYFVELSRGIVLKGAGLEEVWVNVALLLLYTCALGLLVAWRFRKKVA